MKKAIVLILTALALTVPTMTVKADTVDNLHKQVLKLEAVMDKLDSNVEQALDDCDDCEEAYTKAHKAYTKAKRSYENGEISKDKYLAYKTKDTTTKQAYTKACGVVDKESSKLDKAFDKLDKAEDKYDTYMHKYALTASDDRAYSYVQNHIDNFSKSELEQIGHNYSQYVSSKLGVSVVFTTDGHYTEGTLGYYSSVDNTLHYNMEYVYGYDMFDTIAHEVRHAWQHTQAQYDDDFASYVQADDNYDAYYNQEVEVDARAYGQQAEDVLVGMAY